MGWIRIILDFVSGLLDRDDCYNPRPYKASRSWIEVERDKVIEAVKKKRGRTNGSQ